MKLNAKILRRIDRLVNLALDEPEIADDLVQLIANELYGNMIDPKISKAEICLYHHNTDRAIDCYMERTNNLFNREKVVRLFNAAFENGLDYVHENIRVYL